MGENFTWKSTIDFSDDAEVESEADSNIEKETGVESKGESTEETDNKNFLSSEDDKVSVEENLTSGV